MVKRRIPRPPTYAFLNYSAMNSLPTSPTVDLQTKVGCQVGNYRGEVRKSGGGKLPIDGREWTYHVSEGRTSCSRKYQSLRILLGGGSCVSGDSAAKSSDNSPPSGNLVMRSCGPSSNCATRLHPFLGAHGNGILPLASARSGFTSFCSNSISVIQCSQASRADGRALWDGSPVRPGQGK